MLAFSVMSLGWGTSSSVNTLVSQSFGRPQLWPSAAGSSGRESGSRSSSRPHPAGGALAAPLFTLSATFRDWCTGSHLPADCPELLGLKLSALRLGISVAIDRPVAVFL